MFAGGQGQYGRVIGYMEPLPPDSPEKFEFAREIVGNAIPPSFIPACEKGFREACNSGALTGHPVQAPSLPSASTHLPGRRQSAVSRLLPLVLHLRNGPAWHEAS
jgi:translation elongation factor EF-G